MIIDLDKYQKLRKENFPDKSVVCTSGYFDPIHPGHISCIRESKKLGDILVVLVNGDNQCVVKKGKAFLPATDRAYIIDSIKDVDYVVIYDNNQTTACTEAIEIIKPNIFAKGGDRNTKGRVPEVDVVEKHGGKVVYNIGDPKMWSSSNYLQEWVDFVNSKS
jgi:D-beta-D-heptose 7-phosphate kinase/D-beta-D-heptose 1-phosphate adenosyltransferase